MKSLSHLNKSRTLSVGFVIFGVVVRLVQYLSNRSLWFDEANLALNIVNRSYLQLLAPLDNNQAAPPGFLWIEKLSIQILGNNEYALRLFPLIAGIVSLVALFFFAERYASQWATPIAIALFASLPYIVYYGTELKQYSSDIMIALLLSLLLVPVRYKILSYSQLLGLSLVGGVAIWISHPAIFTLGGLELAYLITAPHRERKAILFNRIPVYLTWLLSFGCLYFLTISNTINNDNLVDSWKARYPQSPLDLLWLLDAFGRFFYRPLGFIGIVDGVAILAFVVGCVACFRRNRIIFMTLMAPTVATLIASYLHQYPFRERLVLFLTPFFLILIAEGIVFLLSSPLKKKWIKGLGTVMLVVLLTHPTSYSSRLIFQPELKQEFRSVIEYVQSNQQPSDQIYVYFKGISHMKYYAPKLGYSQTDYSLGTYELPDEGEISSQEWERYQQEFEPFRGQKRVWIIFRVDDSETETLLSYLNTIGRQIEIYKQKGAFVCLYDLS
ncbi:dolichyl-phosphate-mannose-mannosyltransferase family protein [Lyngbya aestuarii BL J]|uniref:Dolichyl-phosphate-mannose-mannosyltransferase family protein n=1 Tax=Lyngbya aestuarii BL J TaxID=1348334 RepID=U7QNM9_9CYAN|nr:glycosyltransferase family 39 protein [Lyngbya aestuarii]ERT09589.1 dolichyl-phosphate-mannose-mannosyltransferase family protein [Lyngbya aestuarii BL J]